MPTTPLIRSFQHLADGLADGPGDRPPGGRRTGGRTGRPPVVTLFSGGLDSSYLLHRLRDLGFGEVHALSVELGEGEAEDDRRQIAERLGAELHVVDARETFAQEFVRPAIAAQAVYLDTHPVSSTLSRPLIARVAVELARQVGAPVVLHTANRSQNSLRRLNGALGQLGFAGWYGSPYDLDPVDRGQKIQELKEDGLEELGERTVSGDSNLWCREFESGVLDDPENHAVPEHMFRWSAVCHGMPGDTVEITFAEGVPTSVDGVRMPLTEVIDVLNRRAGAFGIGRYCGLEHLDDGSKVLEIREMPAACLLLRSYRQVESATLAAETVREKMHLEQLWVREALEGRWFGELRGAVQSFVDACAQAVTGSVTWALRPGAAETRAVRADRPTYIRDREQWERESIAAECAAYPDAAAG
ncbi:argininosuccinate synthase-related protein [Streptomyces sp. HPF1205]|uniref:argininosuccinate synthase-related protein n=1 Tax=Streptomyces sp. HPF1205 TaxID=2873262 RepID=UPI001CED8C2B|nr:argininosuccinate synthase-related protein [Streptomyces sp. HPF1205]